MEVKHKINETRSAVHIYINRPIDLISNTGQRIVNPIKNQLINSNIISGSI